MHYVYVLKSVTKNRVYTGFSSDLKSRVFTYNQGKVKSTKAYRPWILVYYEAYLDVHDAAKREKQLKMHAVKEALLKQIALSLSPE